ncbi:MAG: hypothetical protein E3K32_00735 [wastewater metagenome]|nr:hypothetical protein [Candidatus Loosdrechtia aerotolerans]
MFNQRDIVEKGIIKHINGNHTTVEIVRPNVNKCKNCSACAGIGNKQNLLDVDTIPGVSIGQQVTLYIHQNSPYKSILLLFVVPLVSLLIGSLLGQKTHAIYPGSENLRVVCGGFIFFLLSIMFISLYDKKIRSKKPVRRRIISVDDGNSAVQ